MVAVPLFACRHTISRTLTLSLDTRPAQQSRYGLIAAHAHKPFHADVCTKSCCTRSTPTPSPTNRQALKPSGIKNRFQSTQECRDTIKVHSHFPHSTLLQQQTYLLRICTCHVVHHFSIPTHPTAPHGTAPGPSAPCPSGKPRAGSALAATRQGAWPVRMCPVRMTARRRPPPAHCGVHIRARTARTRAVLRLAHIRLRLRPRLRCRRSPRGGRLPYRTLSRHRRYHHYRRSPPPPRSRVSAPLSAAAASPSRPRCSPRTTCRRGPC